MGKIKVRPRKFCRWPPFRLTLKTKIMLISVGMLLLALTVNSIISNTIFKKEYSQALISQGLLVGQMLRVQLGRLLDIGIKLEDLVGFEEQCQEAVSKYQVSFAMVVDTDGRIVFHNAQTILETKIRDESIKNAIMHPRRIETVILDRRTKMYNIIVPINSMTQNKSYAIIVGLPLKMVEDKSNTMVLSSLFVAIFCFVLIMSLSLMTLSTWVTRPIYNLIETIKKIRTDSNLGSRVKVQSDDEIGILGTAFNQMVDELHYSREEILKQNQRLEQKVEERTIQLLEINELLEMDIQKRQFTEIELAKRAEELANSNAELKQFAYVASHDLKEPLRMISSYLQLLKRRYKDSLDPKALEYIDTTVEGAGRMHNLIDDILDLSRVGTHSFEFQPVSCQEIIEQVISNLEVMITESGVKIQYGPLPQVVADFSQLSRLFQNLMVNAIKFRSKAEPKIWVEAEKIGDCWRFAIRDNGIGIEPTYLERIFMIFQRLHTRSEYPGTGIGLTICKKIVERHGGTIWAESEPGKGSVFYFSLPDHTSEKVG